MMMVMMKMTIFFRHDIESFADKARMEKEEAVWEVTESEIEEFMAVAERLVRECGDIIAEAIRSQTNVEI